MKTPAKKQKLDAEEKAILKAFEADALKSISNVEVEKKRIKKIAKSHNNKVRRISLRMTEWDFLKAQEKAMQEGLPYQTFLSSIIHKYLTNQLHDRSTF